MFSKEEARQMRHNFWISFSKSYPTKWILYRTKIKDFGFKFSFDTKKAMVMLDIEDDRKDMRNYYYQKMLGLSSVLKQYLPDVQFYESFYLDSGKEISRIAVTLSHVSIHNRSTWQAVMIFFSENMKQFELFWQEYKDIFTEGNPLNEEAL